MRRELVDQIFRHARHGLDGEVVHAGIRVLTRALERVKACGAAAADAVLIHSESSEARVRGDQIEFVKQAHERGLGIRVLYRDPSRSQPGLSSAVTSTSDLSPDAVDQMAEQTVALARATAPDPVAGLPADGFASELPELGLFDPADEGTPVESRIEDAMRAESAARAVDPRITDAEAEVAAMLEGSPDLIADWATMVSFAARSP